MSRLPPVEKLPLAVRKNLRDEWESKQEEIEKELSDIVGTAWKVEVDPKQVFAYATDGYAKESLGACIAAYIKGAIWQLKYFKEKYGEDGLNELNSIASAHKLLLDVDENKRFTYCGGDVVDGALRVLFAPDKLGTNIDNALETRNLLNALNEAPAPAGSTISFMSRTSIREDYDPKIEAIRAKIGTIVGKPDIKINPNFDDTYAKLLVESKEKNTNLHQEWETSMGSYPISYFDGLLSQLQYQKFEDDELLQEGFQEAVSKNEIAFRIVDKLKYSSYCEADIEDGVLYIQSTAKTWGTNTSYAAEKLVDRLD